jgi:hypothetical protein
LRLPKALPLLTRHLKRIAAATVCASAVVIGALMLAAASSPDAATSSSVQAPLQDTANPSGTGATGALRSSLAAPPVLPEPVIAASWPRRRGVEANAVVEHPNLPASPIAIASELVEPGQQFRRTVAPGVSLACDRYRSQVQDVGDWDPDVVLALMWRESRCTEHLVSVTNDWGLLQLNATCWAGKGIDRLPYVARLPDDITAPELRCDGITTATPAAQWCFSAKEQGRRTGRRPSSPCDAWLQPETNLRVAYDMWLVRGWQPWCFDDRSRASPACEAAADSPGPPQTTG